MAGNTFKVDMGELAAASKALDKTVFPHLSQTVAFLVDKAYLDWVQSVKQASGVWTGDKERYTKSLRATMNGPYAGEVATDLKLAEEIETGRPEQDLKKMLDSSTKVRVSEKGHRYLIIPMRHNLPGYSALGKAMPAAVAMQAKKLSQSFVTGQGLRPTGQGYKGGTFLSDPKTKSAYLVTSNSYKWGDRLPNNPAPGQGFAKLKPEHTASIYAGMVRMGANSGKAKSSTYMTFRVMSEAPSQKNKWIIGPRPGQFIAKQIQDKINQMSEQAFQSAMAADLMGI